MMRSNPNSSSSNATTLRGTQRDIAEASAITAVLELDPIEKRLYASQIDRAAEELLRSLNEVPLEPLLSRQGAFAFARPAVHDDWVYFTSAFLDLRSKISAIASTSSSTAAFTDEPPAYRASAPADEKDSMIGLDPLTAKIARLIATRRTYETAKTHFLLLQHSQSAPGFTWAPEDFTPARGISVTGIVMKEIAAKMTEMCNWYKFRLPLAESTYRLVSPSPAYSATVLEGVKMEKPIECSSQSSWMLQMGTLTATLDAVRDALGAESDVRAEKIRQSLGHLTSLEINWVGTFMGENPAYRTRNRRITITNELVSMRLALLQAVQKDGAGMELLHLW